MILFRHKASPNFLADPVTIFNTPSGIPASFAKSANSKVAKGVSDVGLKQLYYLLLKLGQSYEQQEQVEKFQAVMATTTPLETL